MTMHPVRFRLVVGSVRGRSVQFFRSLEEAHAVARALMCDPGVLSTRIEAL